MQHEELKRIENEKTAVKKVTSTQDYTEKRGPNPGSNNGLEAKISKGGTRIRLTMDSEKIPPLPTRVSLQGRT